MGACLEPTEAMGPYAVELRGRSFYLNRRAADPSSRTGRYEAVLPAADRPALLAALDQVTGHPQWTRWENEGRPAEPDTSWTLAPGDTGPAAPAAWTVTRDGDRLRLTGPWTVWHERGELWGAEITYADMDQLRAELTPITA